MRRFWLAGIATLLTCAAPALAAPFFRAQGGPNSDSAVQCDEINPQFGDMPVSFSLACSSRIGSITANAVSSFGHIGAFSQAFAHTGDSLIAKTGAEALFEDTLVFSSANPGATFADVSANLLLHGVMDFAVQAGGGAGDSIEGAVTLNNQFFFFRFFNNSTDGFSVEQNAFSVNGTLGPTTDAVLSTPLIRVALNSPVQLRLRLQAGSAAAGFSAAGSDFGGSFKFVTGRDAFDLPDGVTVNAGTWLVNNRFIDPLAAVPEPSSWALMLAGFGLIGTAARRRRASFRVTA